MGAPSFPGIERGCGFRISGGCYLETGFAEEGVPFHNFLCDPPVPMTVGTKVGVELVQRGKEVHVLDYVGSDAYPHAADFIEEGKRFGFSRRVPKTLDFSRLGAGSRMLIVHARGLITNRRELLPYFDEALADFERTSHRCPLFTTTNSKAHAGKECAACFRDLYALPPATEHIEARGRVGYFRKFASTKYGVFPLAPDAPEAATTSALIASLPITNISVIQSSDGSSRETADKIRQQLRTLREDYGTLSVTEPFG